MKKRSALVVLAVVVILAAYYFLVPNNPIKKAVDNTIAGKSDSSYDQGSADSDTSADSKSGSSSESDSEIEEKSKNANANNLENDGQDSSQKNLTDREDNKDLDGRKKQSGTNNAKFDPKTYAKGGVVKLMQELKQDNQAKVFDSINGLKGKMDKSDCPDLIKAQKGTDFNCRTVVKNPLLSSKIIYESAYKNGSLVSFKSKVAGVKEIVSIETNVNKRIANNKKKAVKSKNRASSAVKFSLEGRDFLEIYFDENFMTDELQYYYFDLKQAVLRDEFYKEKDFQKRVDLVILAINKSIKVINDQCKVQEYDKACEAYKKYLKINIRGDIKKIISAAESAKIESAFFD